MPKDQILSGITTWLSAAGMLLGIIAMTVSIVALDDPGTILFEKVLLGFGGATLGFGISYLYLYLLKRKRTARIFLSYGHEDQALSQQLSQDLRRIGYIVLLPEEEIKVGDNIAERIDASLSRSDIMVAIISPRSHTSEWVSREIDMAQQKGLRILPIVVDDAKVPGSLRDMRYIAMRESYSSTYEALQDALRGVATVP